MWINLWVILFLAVFVLACIYNSDFSYIIYSTFGDFHLRHARRTQKFGQTKLSELEKQILRCVHEDKDFKHIGSDLGLSRKEVKAQVLNLCYRFHLYSAYELRDAVTWNWLRNRMCKQLDTNVEAF